MPEEVYAIINDSMPGIIKIGSGDTMARLAEANAASTWMPTFYRVVLVKDVHVQCAKKNKKILQKKWMYQLAPFAKQLMSWDKPL